MRFTNNSYSFTIIIPHKDIPELLVRCLKSIPDREDIQIIIVDDKSSDADTYIEKIPELSRPNVEIYFTTEGKGAGYARNVGLRQAKGKWILFSDSDDFYFTDRLDTLLNIAPSVKADVIVIGVQINTISNGTILDYEENLDTISPLDNYEFNLRHFEPWRKMVRRSFLQEHNLQFEEVVASNDVRFHLQLMSVVPKENIVQFNSNVYCWENRKGSLCYTNNLHNLKCRFNVGLRANQFSYEQGWGYLSSTNWYLWRIKQISIIHFYLYFIKECWYLGIIKSIADYAFCCEKEQKKLNYFMRFSWVVASWRRKHTGLVS